MVRELSRLLLDQRPLAQSSLVMPGYAERCDRAPGWQARRGTGVHSKAVQLRMFGRQGTAASWLLMAPAGGAWSTPPAGGKSYGNLLPRLFVLQRPSRCAFQTSLRGRRARPDGAARLFANSLLPTSSDDHRLSLGAPSFLCEVQACDSAYSRRRAVRIACPKRVETTLLIAESGVRSTDSPPGGASATYPARPG